MKRYEIIFARSARKELEDLNKSISEKIKGGLNRWRIRVGDYRVIYSINDKICLLEILIIRHRRDVYR